jgi:NIMA (never in mitosis gene a)-related kinase
LGCVLYELVALNPPFTAKDMKGLYQRVMKGVYPKIPSHYSSDLTAILSSLLQIDPKKRPTTDQVLHMPIFVAKHNELKLQEQGQSADSEDGLAKSINMLGTIKLPNNMKLIQGNLPSSNYETDKPKKEKKLRKDDELDQILEENDE